MTEHQISEDEQQKAYEDKMNANFYAEQQKAYEDKQNLLHQQKMKQEKLASEYQEFLAWKAQKSEAAS